MPLGYDRDYVCTKLLTCHLRNIMILWVAIALVDFTSAVTPPSVEGKLLDDCIC